MGIRVQFQRDAAHDSVTEFLGYDERIEYYNEAGRDGFLFRKKAYVHRFAAVSKLPQMNYFLFSFSDQNAGRRFERTVTDIKSATSTP